MADFDRGRTGARTLALGTVSAADTGRRHRGGRSTGVAGRRSLRRCVGTGGRRTEAMASSEPIAAGADGLMIEVHPHPEVALSDGDQSLKPDNFAVVMQEVRQIAQMMGKTL